MYLHVRVVWVRTVKKPLIHWNQVGESNLGDKCISVIMVYLHGIYDEYKMHTIDEVAIAMYHTVCLRGIWRCK